jgi:hypothetical protein
MIGCTHHNRLTDDIQSISQKAHPKVGYCDFLLTHLMWALLQLAKGPHMYGLFGHAFVCGPESWG